MMISARRHSSSVAANADANADASKSELVFASTMLIEARGVSQHPQQLHGTRREGPPRL